MFEGRIVEVMQDDIDQGCREDSNNCAVARAFARACPEATRTSISVDAREISCFVDLDGYGTMWFETPSEARDFIEAYDTDPATREREGLADPAPFSFTLPAVARDVGSV